MRLSLTSADTEAAHLRTDLWRADDAQKLREYLFFWEARNRKGGETPTEANITAVKASWDDPIHSQQVYVSRDMRKELFKMHGVKVSFRFSLSYNIAESLVDVRDSSRGRSSRIYVLCDPSVLSPILIS